MVRIWWLRGRIPTGVVCPPVSLKCTSIDFDSFSTSHGLLLRPSASTLRLVGQRTRHKRDVGPSCRPRLIGSPSEDASGLCVNTVAVKVVVWTGRLPQLMFKHGLFVCGTGDGRLPKLCSVWLPVWIKAEDGMDGGIVKRQQQQQLCQCRRCQRGLDWIGAGVGALVPMTVVESR